MAESKSLDGLVGMRVRISIAEPTGYAQRHEADLGEGTIRRVVRLLNARGHPYDEAFVVLDRPFDWRAEELAEAPVRTQSTVVSVTDAFTLGGLEDLLPGSSHLFTCRRRTPKCLILNLVTRASGRRGGGSTSAGRRSGPSPWFDRDTVHLAPGIVFPMVRWTV